MDFLTSFQHTWFSELLHDQTTLSTYMKKKNFLYMTYTILFDLICHCNDPTCLSYNEFFDLRKVMLTKFDYNSYLNTVSLKI